MKVGLSNHQSVGVCVPLIIFEPLGIFHEIWYGGNAIQVDLDAIIINPLPSTILMVEVQNC
jgi:hypothetical protein